MKKLKTYSGWYPFHGLSNGGILMQIQSGRTVPLNCLSRNTVFQAYFEQVNKLKKILAQKSHNVTEIWCFYYSQCVPADNSALSDVLQSVQTLLLLGCWHPHSCLHLCFCSSCLRSDEAGVPAVAVVTAVFFLQLSFLLAFLLLLGPSLLLTSVLFCYFY